MQFFRRALAVIATLSIFALAFTVTPTSFAAEFDCSTATDVTQAECEVLMDLYNATGGDTWLTNTNWTTSTEVCTWYGVQCTAGVPPLSISGINLPTNNLAGSMSTVAWNNLTALTDLYLYENALTGTLPTLPTSLNWVDLSNNSLSGSIPASIGTLTNLAYLSLNNNDLSGPLPTEMGNLTQIVSLFLSDNAFTGALPANMSTWTALQTLYIGQNNFSGAMPNLTNAENLAWLDLYQASDTCAGGNENGLNGEIGTWLTGANFPSMENLNLAENCFSGDMPDLSGAPVAFANLSQNPWTTGPIPAWISSSTTLQNISLDFTQRTGTIPSMASNVLEQVSFSQNFLAGNIPTSFNGTNHPNMTALSVYANSLGGSLPEEIGTLTNLTYLSLQGNNFNSLPASLTNLTQLETYNGLWINYNVLEPTEMSAPLIAFIDSVASPASPAWQNTQTLAPSNLQVEETTTSSVTISWTHRGDFNYDGRYEIGVGTTDGGPYTFDEVNFTPNKNYGEWTITQIDENTDLSPETTYYFVVRKVRNFLPFFAPQSTSGNSAQISAVTTDDGGGEPTEKPSKPKLVSPAAGETVIGDASPAFTWDENPGEEQVTAYRLFVRDSKNVVLVNETFDAAQVCAGGVCTGDIGELTSPVNLKNGDYSFRVRATNVVGNNDSAYRAFSVAFPAKPELVSPIDDIVIDDPQPEFTWLEVEDAAEYRVTIYDANKKKVGGSAWLESATVNCDGTDCAFDLTPSSLKNGVYTWKVEARNTTISPSKSQSVKGKFKVAFPGAPELVSPIDNVEVNDNQPLFTWTEVEAAAEYRLKIYNAAKKNVGGTVWLDSATMNCNGATCSYDIVPSSLKNGAHTWTVEARNLGLSGSKMKSTKGAFKVVFPGVPTDLTPAPDTTLDIASPTFTWSPVENATKYRLIITRNAKPTPQALNQVFNAVDICTVDTCTVDLSALDTPVTLKKGAHKWQVKAVAPGGYTSATAKQPFSIVLP